MQRFGFASAVKLLRVTHKCLIQPPHRAASHFCHEYKNILTRDSKSHTLQQQPCSLLQHLIPSGFKTSNRSTRPRGSNEAAAEARRTTGSGRYTNSQKPKTFQTRVSAEVQRSHPDVWFVCRWRDDVPSFCSLLCSLNTVRN